jgi:hypothetical protein
MWRLFGTCCSHNDIDADRSSAGIGPSVPSEHSTAEASFKFGGDAPKPAYVDESSKENAGYPRPLAADGPALSSARSAAGRAPRPLEPAGASLNSRATQNALKP